MLIKIGRSFVGRTVLIIAALISIMAALLFYCNLYATWAVRERASDSYLSMGNDIFTGICGSRTPVLEPV